MTGVPPTDSIIADSTASSSSPPRTSVDPGTDNTLQSNAPTTVPSAQKRVGRTYGRPKSDTTIQDVLRDDIGSRARILKTAPLDADDQVIPESDDANERIPSFDGSDWRAKLKAIDEGFGEFGERNGTRQAINTSINQTYDASVTSQGIGEALQPPSESPLSSLSQLSLTGRDEKAQCATSTSVIETDALFSASTLSSLLPLGSPSSGPSTLFSKNNLGGSITLSKRSRPSHKRGESPEASDSENASPKHPFPISTPKHRSTPTPPTSPLAGESISLAVTASGEESANSTTRAGKKGRHSVRSEVKDKGKGKWKVKEKEKRIKAPTKKEVLELRKESARLLADQHVTIRSTQTHSTHTIASLFNKLKATPIEPRQDSDPITSFSSPGNVFKRSGDASLSDEDSPVGLVSSSLRSTKAISKPPPVPSPESDNVDPAPSQEDSDEEMPDPGTLLRDSEEKRLRQSREEEERAVAARKAKELEERKRKALNTRNYRSSGRTAPSKAGGEDSDTDDLEVEYLVGPPAPTHEGKDVRLSLSSRNPPKPFNERERKRGNTSRSHVSQKSLELAARPAFMIDQGKKGTRGKRGHENLVSHQDLNDLILQRANKQSGAIEEMKKEQWVKAGGILKDQRRAGVQEKSVTDWLHKGASREDAMDIDEDEDEDGDDPEYSPQDVGEQESNDSDEELGDVEGTHGREDALEQTMDVSEGLDVDTDKENHRPALRRQSARAIVDSDEEDETANDQRAITREPTVLVPDTSFTLDAGAGDSLGEDKENSAELAFDLSEDKENARVPRHLPRGRSFIGASDVPGDDVWSTSPPRSSRKPFGSLDGEGLGESALIPPPLAQRRDASQDRVLQVLHEEDKDATLAPVTSTRKGVLRRRYSSSSPGSDDVEGLKPISPLGFSQLFAEGSNSPKGKEPDPASALGEGGFSQFFSQGRTQVDIFDGSPADTKRPIFLAQRSGSAASEEDIFEFTQPNTLLPSVRISESQKREIDEMFGKDQEFKLDEARKSREQAKARYTSVLGPPTFGSFAPSQPTQPSPHSIRRPLETLTLASTTQLDSSPEDQPLRRSRLLRERPRGRETPPASPSPSPRPRNAFDVLRDAAKGKGKGKEHYPKQRLERSDFVEAEAQESDEEAMLGFGGAKGDDEEEIGDEDPDAIVEGLVNDAAMDVNVQAADLVLEKHMEHQAADDAALTKLHQDAADGKLRGKRRDRGIGFEDSDSEDDFKRPHKPLNKKRKVEGDTLDAYGENPETRPFYKAYQADLAEEDDPTLAFLKQEVSVHMQESEEDDSSGEYITEEVNPAEIRRQIRELAASKRSLSPKLDPNNVGWVDPEDQAMQDTSIEVRRMHANKSVTTNHSTLDHVDFRGSFKQKNVDAREQEQLRTWATLEARTHASASGRGGFSRKEEVGASSRKQGRGPISTIGSSQNVDARILTKSSTSSLLSRVEKRKGFDS